MTEFEKFLKTTIVSEVVGDLPSDVHKTAPEGEFAPGNLDASVFQPEGKEEAPIQGGSNLRKIGNVAGKVAKTALQVTDPLFGGASLIHAAKKGWQQGVASAGHSKGQPKDKPVSKNLSPIDRSFLIAWLYSDELKNFALKTPKASKGILAVQNFLRQHPKVPTQQALVQKLNLQNVAEEMFKDLDLTALAQSFAAKQPGDAYKDALAGLKSKFA